MDNMNLFTDNVPDKVSTQLSILPVSVIDIDAQGKRGKEDHSKQSSRSNFSPFPTEVADLCCEFFLRDSTLIFDPFAGWGERAQSAKKFSREYLGIDISPIAIDKALAQYEVKNTLADARTFEIPSFNGLLTCPPYWNLERYESNDGLDKIKTWEQFLSNLDTIFRRCFDSADKNSIFCVMVGDWRKKGIYYDLEYEVCKMFKSYGASVVDKIVVSRKKISKIKIMLPQCKRLGYSVRVHENLLVFKK